MLFIVRYFCNQPYTGGPLLPVIANSSQLPHLCLPIILALWKLRQVDQTQAKLILSQRQNRQAKDILNNHDF